MDLVLPGPRRIPRRLAVKTDVYPKAPTVAPPDRLRAIALWAALLVPLGLLHAFVLAEICIAATDILFIAAMVRRRDLSWARTPWFTAAMLWWVWLVFCSNPWLFTTENWRLGLVEALVVIRLILFAAALQHWVLTTNFSRYLAWLVLALSCLWIGVESWEQYLTGTNIFGDHRFGDGALTGPFWKPRAGALYAHLLYVALLPPVVAFYAKSRTRWQLAALAITVIGVVTSVLIGQRSPTVLAGLGLCIAAGLIPQLRRAAVVAAAVAVLFLLATPFISPPTYGKLIGETSRNFAHFSLSPYGQLYIRGIVMGLASPLHGWGYNGFRALCTRPQFGAGFPAFGIAPTKLALGACNLHPHNYYVQSFADAGYPGLILFVIMIGVGFKTLATGLWKNPDAIRVGVLICFITFIWPFETGDAFPTLYMLGWFYYALGLGLALTNISVQIAKSPVPGVLLKSEPVNA
jgi:O-antigen ligase